ncbi:MAG: isocitrate lyase/phosphoenolpyruvate mutase family protein [Pseudonocardiaceae bacterium]
MSDRQIRRCIRDATPALTSCSTRGPTYSCADADRGELLPEAIRRGKAFLDAGAPVVFVPGVVAREEIRVLVKEFGPQKLSVISVPGASLPVRKLQSSGSRKCRPGHLPSGSH